MNLQINFTCSLCSASFTLTEKTHLTIWLNVLMKGHELSWLNTQEMYKNVSSIR